MRWERRLQLAAVIGFIAAYSALSHYSNSHPGHTALATALALAPMVGFAWLLAWRVKGVSALALVIPVTALLFYLGWPSLTRNFSRVYLLEQAGFYTLSLLTFGATLRPGRVPLCTQLADHVHGPLSELEIRYTRQVTVAWTIFFAANLSVTFALFALAPLTVWSMFVNFCSLPLVLLMFLGEYAVRRRVLPKVEATSSMLAILRAFFALKN